MTSSQKINRGVILILLSAVMFGSYGVWSKLIGDSFGVFYQGWTRALIIAGILFPILLHRKEIVPIQKKDWMWLAVFLAFTSATQAPIFYAYTHMDISSATLLFFVSMLLTMYVVGFTFLKEKLSSIKIFSFITALLGMYMVFSFSLEQFALLAALMAILNGIASGGEVAFSKKLSDVYSPLYLTFLSWLVIIPTNGLLSFILGETQHLPDTNIVWLWQMGYVVASLFAFWFVIAGVKYIEASIGGLIGLLEIVFSISFGIMLFSEKLTYRVMAGAILILLAASLPHITTLFNKRRTKRQNSI